MVDYQLLDHLVYAVPDLAAAVRDFAEHTGITPAEGGRHVGVGTRNYLVGLGPTSYLEIIGPDVQSPAAPGARVPFGVDTLTARRLVTWAIHPADIESVAAASAAAGADLGPITPLSRRRPDGVLLQWKLCAPSPAPFDGVTPFLIDWDGSPHPASDPDLPSVRLLSLRLRHPDPPAVRAVLDALGIEIPVRAGPAGLSAEIETPHGTILLR